MNDFFVMRQECIDRMEKEKEQQEEANGNNAL
jgi:hypothetical protein